MPAQQECNIDYIGVLDYLRDNQGIPYHKLEGEKDPVERARLEEVMNKGQRATNEMRKMVEACEEKYDLQI